MPDDDDASTPASADVILAGLLEAIAAGDRASFARLYELTSGRLFAVALHMTRQREMAEDVLQDGYLRIWHKARLFDRRRGSAMGWLVTLVRRAALDRLRQGSTDPIGSRRVENREEVIDPETAEEDLLRGIAEDLRDCLERLEQRYRGAVLLAFYYGLTHEELADRLHVPLGTAKSWVRRGLERLKKCLDDQA